MNKNQFDFYLKTYIFIISILNLGLWLSQYSNGPRSYKILIAIIMLTICTLAPDKISDQPHIEPAIKFFGVLGASIIFLVLYSQ